MDFLDGLAGIGKDIYEAEKARVANAYGPNGQRGILPPIMRNMRRYGIQQNPQSTPTNPLGVGTIDDEVANGYGNANG